MLRETTGAAVSARFFGDFSVHVCGRPVERWRAGKARSLFQYLLVNRGRVVTRDKLYEVLWPAREWSPTGSSLKVAMHGVRQVLHAADSGHPTVEIVNRDHGYMLKADNVWLDLDEFSSAIDTARAAELTGDHATALRHYTRAVDLCTGDFLATETGDWIDEQRACSKALVLQALHYLRADALRRGDRLGAVRMCQRLLAVDPYQEELYQTLMVVHGKQGELGQVQTWYDICLRRLQHDLDVEPTETTYRIFTRAIRGELREQALVA
ncbi:SARP family transcriptional regulator [Lentzea sp. PSKA42]|uniref:SARP family transcriptional regulator n=1 Tax=Lentzea indica TaxID=2604800 RepID=A0ABX1FF24_9PSEU|nr:BTAD domain-containing putative transcriptional regulator [Lentzea indica]NKE57564.1 SARP family transcriptional regulator [Lentzea indica]